MDQFRQFNSYLNTIEKKSHEEIGPHAFPIIVRESCGFTRDQLASHLGDHGVDTRTLFSSMPTQCPGFSFLGAKVGEFSNAEYIGNNGIHIGVHQDMGKAECDYVLNVINDFISKQS